MVEIPSISAAAAAQFGLPPQAGPSEFVVPIDVLSPSIEKRKHTQSDAAAKTKSSKLRALIYSSFFDVCREFIEYAMMRWSKERQILLANWRMLTVGIFFQYIHKVCTNVAYYLHVQRQPLRDLGFELFPALPRQAQVLSEILFFALFLSTLAFMASPFFVRSHSHLFTGVMVVRFLGVCFFAQILRCITFLVTILPGPNYHCRPQSPDYNPPRAFSDFFFRPDAFYGCGDLLFSSHTIFVLLCTLTYTKFADGVWIKRGMWLLVVVFGILVVSARKHYSVDIIVAWYTVPLLWIAYERFFPEKIPSEILTEMNQRKSESVSGEVKDDHDLKKIVHD